MNKSNELKLPINLFQQKQYSLSELKEFGLKTCLTYDHTDEMNIEIIISERFFSPTQDCIKNFEDMINLRSPIPEITLYETIENSNSFYLDKVITKEDVIEKIKSGFKHYLLFLESELKKYSDYNPFLTYLNDKFLNKGTVEEKVDLLKQKIEVARFFIANKLIELIDIKVKEINNFILPENFFELLKSEYLYTISTNLDPNYKTYNFGLNRNKIISFNYNYSLISYDNMESNFNHEVAIEILTSNNAEKELSSINFRKTNQDSYTLRSYSDTRVHFLDKNEATKAMSELFVALNKSTNSDLEF